MKDGSEMPNDSARPVTTHCVLPNDPQTVIGTVRSQFRYSKGDFIPLPMPDGAHVISVKPTGELNTFVARVRRVVRPFMASG